MKNKTAKLLLTVIITISATSCGLTGEEVARLPIDEIGFGVPASEKQATITLKKGEEIAIWSDMDVSYNGNMQMSFVLKVSKGDEVVESLNFSPFKKNITIGEKKININGQMDWSFEGKNAEFTAPEDGEYTFSGRLTGTENESLVLRKSDLILKK